MSRPRPEQVDALCCACGNVRKVARYAVTLTHNRELVCRPCGARTMHAFVLPSGVCDWRERENHPEPDRVEVDPLDVVRSLGWLVVEVEGLRVLATIVDAVDVVMVRPNLTRADLTRVAERVLSRDDGGN